MAKIYTEDGTLDYALAAQSLIAVQQSANQSQRGDATKLATAAALLDIAVSLNALVSQFAPVEFVDQDVDAREVGPDGEPLGEEEREEDAPLEPGDRIQFDDDEAVATGVVVTVEMSEGSPAGLVHWDGTPEGAMQKVWLDDLRREVGGSTLDEVYGEGAPKSDDEPNGDDGIELEDDVDADFEPEPVKVKKSKKDKRRA